MFDKQKMLYEVRQYDYLLYIGTMIECYEIYPILACVEIGKKTARGLWMKKLHG